jgi:CRP/FNR family transcriptional regulator, nitrogen oxide reductase regulator
MGQERQPWGPSVGVRSGASNPLGESATNYRAALVQRFPLFSNVSLLECREIASAAREQEYSRRQIIYLEGDPVRQVVLLTSGHVKIVQCGRNGNEVILRLNGPGDVVGTFGLCTQACHRSMAQALSPSKALVWEAAVFESIAQGIPVLRRNTTHILSKRLEDLEERFREISTERVSVRLSHEILRLLNQVGRRVNGVVEISLSHEDLAQLIGTTLFTVSRLLSDWDQRGIVSTRRKSVSVHNLQALVELAESNDE